MVARNPPNGYSPQQTNGDPRDRITTLGRRPDGATNPKFRHIKDLQAKAEAEARDLGAHTPVRLPT